MLTYNNKILKVGSGALKFPTPRNLSIVFKPVSNQGVLWVRDSAASQDDWPKDFGDSDWMCSTVGGGFWEYSYSRPYIERQEIFSTGGAYSRNKKSYFYRAFFQMGNNDSSLTWMIAQSAHQATMEAGTSLTTKSTNTYYSGMNKILFNIKLGTFDKTKQVYFAYLAWNSDAPYLYNFGYCRTLGTTLSPTVTFKEQL